MKYTVDISDACDYCPRQTLHIEATSDAKAMYIAAVRFRGVEDTDYTLYEVYDSNGEKLGDINGDTYSRYIAAM